jgi:hypothetical protein
VDVAVCPTCTVIGRDLLRQIAHPAQECVALRSSFKSCSKCHKVGCAETSYAESGTRTFGSFSYDWERSSLVAGCDTSRECKSCHGRTRPGPDVMRGGERLCKECDTRWRCELCEGVVCDGCAATPNGGGQPPAEIAECTQCGTVACKDCRDDDGCTHCHRALCNHCKRERTGCTACGRWLCFGCAQVLGFESCKCDGCAKPVCAECNIYEQQPKLPVPEDWCSEAGCACNELKHMCPACEPRNPTKCSGCGAKVCKDCAEECGTCRQQCYCEDCAPVGGDRLSREFPFEPMRHEAAVRLGLPVPLRCDFCGEVQCPECQPAREQGGAHPNPMLECDTCSRHSCGPCAAIVRCDCCGSSVCAEDRVSSLGGDLPCSELSFMRICGEGRTEGRPTCCDLGAGRGPEMWESDEEDKKDEEDEEDEEVEDEDEELKDEPEQ